MSFDKAGTYYLIACGENSNYMDSPLVMTLLKVVVKEADPTPKVRINETGYALPEDDGHDYAEKKGFSYSVGEEATPLTVSVESSVEGGEYSYQWYKTQSKKSNGGTLLEREATCIPDTSKPTSKGYYYKCKVTYKLNGKTYTAWSDVDTNPYIYVKASEAQAPQISSQPDSASYFMGESPAPLKITAKVTDGGSLSYQWYKNDKESAEGGEAVSGETKKSFTPPAPEKSGKTYYYCEVTNTLQKFKKTVASEVACVEFRNVEEAIGGAFEGKGTEKEPYLLSDAEDFETLASKVKDEGIGFKGIYFKITNDIEMPKDWDGIGYDTKKGSNGANLKPFSGNIDGDGHNLTFAFGSKPLFNYVREASVKNIDIYAPYIPYNGLVANYKVDYGSAGSGTGVATIDIESVTVKAGSVIKGSGFIGGYASGQNTINILDCEIEKGVKIGWDAEKNQPAGESRIGSFGGDFNGTVKNSVSAAEVYGVDYVGGIVGGKGQTVGDYAFYNCSFTGKITATGKFAGGIAGGGYSGAKWGVSSAPNTACATIENCYVSAEISGGASVGGVFGGEEGSVQNWSDSYVRNNLFVGKITATEGKAGGIIGRMNSLNAKNIIENNYYAESSAKSGIGSVGYIDTNCENHETESGAQYFDTSKDFGSQEKPSGAPRANHNRTDDPMGDDKEKLAAGVTKEQLASGEITEALNKGEGSLKNWVQGETFPELDDGVTESKLEISGEYKSSYNLGEDLDLSGAEIKVIYSDKNEKTIDWTELKIEGYDKDARGVQTVKLSYGAASATIEVTVLTPETGKITVYLSVLGDAPHGDDGGVHTLADGNLSAWIDKTAYKVDANATVLDVIAKAAEQKGLTFKNESGSYITEVTYNGQTVGELTNGNMSGWMFALNGIYGDLSVDKQFLEDGDEIIFHYTDDYSREYNSSETNADEIIAMIDALPDIEKLTLEDAAKDAYYDSLVKVLKNNGSAKLDKNKSTENSRTVLALTAIGRDASSVAGYNLLEPLTDMNYLKRQGINGVIFALIAFDSHDYKIPQSNARNAQVTRELLTEEILAAQLEDGGFALAGEKADADMTAMALQALAPYADDSKVKAAIDAALDCLSDMQSADGGFRSWDSDSSESCSQVIIALAALGIDPAADARFIKNGNSVMDALLGFHTGEGFEHIAGGGVNQMATEQAYLAMAAYARMADGQTSLYDMTDIKLTASPDDGNNGNIGGGGTTEETKPEKTGDENNLGAWIALTLIGGAGALALKRKKEEDNAA